MYSYSELFKLINTVVKLEQENREQAYSCGTVSIGVVVVVDNWR